MRSWFALCVFIPSFGTAQAQTSKCRAGDLELFREGGEAGLGHSVSVVGLRNTSARRCTLFGTPRLLFFDKTGRSLTLPYSKNELDYMFAKQQERLVNLAPGDFAYILIGTWVGDQHLHFKALRAVLPGDDTQLVLNGVSPNEISSLNVSPFVAGIFSGSEWAAPTKRVVSLSSAPPALSVTLDVPPRPEMGFDAHFAWTNSGSKPLRIDRKPCTLHEKLTDSAGKEMTAVQDCGVWQGQMSREGLLRPNDKVTMDLTIAGDEFAAKGEHLCRPGNWTAELTLEMPAGTTRYAAFPLHLATTPTVCGNARSGLAK